MTVGGCKPGNKTAKNLPNIVVITLDTLRADRLGTYGYFRDTSPSLDQFARESVVFDRCLAPMATTLPSHTTLFTGTYPIEHGILANVQHGGYRFKTSSRLRSFAEMARDAGYQTAGFISAAPLKIGTGIEAGFQTYDQPNANKERSAGATTQAALKWLTQRDNGPYFLWVHYFDPHEPYAAPPPFDSMFKADDQLEEYLSKRRFFEQAPRPTGRLVQAKPANDAYDGEVRYMDEQVGRLLDHLRNLDRWTETIVVILGDHGEGLCQHNEAGHGYIYDEQLHVPLMMRIPNHQPRRIAIVMSIADVLPTLLGMTPELPFPEFTAQASGANVLASDYTARPVFAQNSVRNRSDHQQPTYAMTEDDWKFVYQVGGQSALYHLKNDPFELENVYDRFSEIAESRKQQILARIAEYQDRAMQFKEGENQTPEPLDPRLVEELRGLGYVE